MHQERTPQETRQQIVAMYQQGETIVRITEATGSTAIDSMLRQEGIAPDRSRRFRNPETRKQLAQLAKESLRQAAADLASIRSDPFFGVR